MAEMMHDYDRREAAKAMSPWFKAFVTRVLAKHKADLLQRHVHGIDEYDVAATLKKGFDDQAAIQSARTALVKNFEWGPLLAKEADAFGKAVNDLLIAKTHLAGEDAPDWDPMPNGLAIYRLKLYGESFEYDRKDPFSRVEHPGDTKDREIDTIVRKELGGQPRHGGFTTVHWSLEPDPTYDADNLVYTVSAEWLVAPKEGGELLLGLLGPELDKRVLELLPKVRADQG